MKKRISLGIFSLLAAMSLANIASPVLAAPAQSAVVTTQAINSTAVQEEWEPWWKRHHVNQVFCGRAGSGLTLIFKGRDQGNFGNSGVNDGFNQDNNGNAGNEFVQVKKTNAPLSINQFHCGTSTSDNFVLNVGVNQANTGNQGLNRGFNQDNGVNAGNQIIN